MAVTKNEAKEVLGVLVLCLLLGFVLRALAGCSRPPVAMPAAAAAEIEATTVHCFVVVARPAAVDADIDSTVCFADDWSCGWVRSIVEDHAAAIGVLSLTEECEER